MSNLKLIVNFPRLIEWEGKICEDLKNMLRIWSQLSIRVMYQNSILSKLFWFVELQLPTFFCFCKNVFQKGVKTLKDCFTIWLMASKESTSFTDLIIPAIQFFFPKFFCQQKVIKSCLQHFFFFENIYQAILQPHIHFRVVEIAATLERQPKFFVENW